jgi:hypothetical protein
MEALTTHTDVIISVAKALDSIFKEIDADSQAVKRQVFVRML